MNLQLIRYCYGPDHVAGLLKIGEGNQQMSLWTLERPWQGNAKFVSCIPDGGYGLIAFDSPEHPDCWVITPVADRTGILIHVGNEVDDTQGCVLVGQSQEPGHVWNSKQALRMINFVLNRNEQHTIQIGSGLGAVIMHSGPEGGVPREGNDNNGGGELSEPGGEGADRTADSPGGTD